MKLSINKQSVTALRDYADEIPQICSKLEEDILRLINTYNNVSDEVGPHNELFEEMMFRIRKAEEISNESINELAYMLKCTADKMEAYIIHDASYGTVALGNTDIKQRNYSEIIEKEDLSQADKDGIIRDLLDQNVTEQRKLSDLRAEWSDAEARGNSDCILKDDAEFVVEYKSSGDKVTYSGEEFKKYMRDKYGQDYVSYLHKEPDFEPFEQIFDRVELEDFLSTKYGRDVHIDRIPEGHIEVERMGTNRSDTYGAAYDYCIDVLGKGISRTDLAEFMKKKDLTWHECGDRRIIRLVPSEINQIFAHTGGIGIEKDFEALQTALEDILTNETKNVEGMSLQKTASHGNTEGLIDAIEYRHAENRKRKKELF